MRIYLASLAVALPLIVSATPAAAEPTSFVIGGAQLMVQRQFEAGGALEVGTQVLEGPASGSGSVSTHVFAHGLVAGGVSINDGEYQQLRVGAEGHACVLHRVGCAVVGLDVGYQHDHAIEDGSSGKRMPYDLTAHDAMAVFRGGLEAGTSRLRIRTMLEVTARTQLNHQDMVGENGGLALGAGVGYAF